MDVAMWEHHTFDSEVFSVAKFTTLIPLSLLISCKLSFPTVGLKMSSLPTLALISPNRIFIIKRSKEVKVHKVKMSGELNASATLPSLEGVPQYPLYMMQSGPQS
jgi:hypothetical protein